MTSNNADDVVVTPSGHLCLKRLVLAKLLENGGIDPFSDAGRPLSEDDLVSLQASKNRPNMPPPPASVSSFSGTLQQLAKEYDSVVLELFDTRKSLQESRRELSQALYQNDAAIRVVARLSQERDTARHEAQRFQAIAEAGGSTTAPASKSAPSINGSAEEPPSKKKPRLDESADLPLTDSIPGSDLDTMLGTWEQLHQVRRSKAKSTYVLPESWSSASSQSWHKSTCRGVTAMAQCEKYIASAGKDKHIIVYDLEGQVVVATLSPKCLVHSLDIMPKDGGEEGTLLVMAAAGQELRVYDSSTQDVLGSCDLGDDIVGVNAYPTGKHCSVVTKGGKMAIFRVGASGVQHISTFTAEDGVTYSNGALHPDGLVYAAGTSKGEVMLWDLKNKCPAGTMQHSAAETEDAVVCLTFSSNGYNVASAHASGAVKVWDMRKSKFVAEVNISGDDVLKSVTALAFHPDGKYLAYGGQGGLHITLLKEWKVSASLAIKVATSILWDPKWIATASDRGRTVTFHEGK